MALSLVLHGKLIKEFLYMRTIKKELEIVAEF